MKYYFILSPSLAVLDSWYPIISTLEENNLKLTCVIPSYKILKTINTIKKINLIQSKFDSYIYIDGDKLIQVRELEKIISKKSILFLNSFVQRIINKIRLVFKTLENRKKQIYVSHDITNDKSVILMDIDSLKFNGISSFVKEFKHLKIFSLSHGLAIKPPRNEIIDLREYQIIVFAYSFEELEYYKKSYGLNQNQIKVTGIPRHDKDWLKKIDKPVFDENNGIILVVSRPYNSYFFTKKEKQNALRKILKLSYQLDRKIVIKLHPKGEKKLSFFYIFGFILNRKNWRFNDLIGIPNLKINIAICLKDSSVIKDLVIMGIPTVIMAEKTVIEKWRNNIFKSDSFYSIDKLNSYKPLYEIVNDFDNLQFLQSNAKSLIEKQKKAYFNYYHHPDGSLSKIVNYIVGV